MFGTLSRPAKTTAKQTKTDVAPRREIPTLDQHAAYLRSLNYPAWLIPGTPERTEMLQRFIEHTRPVEAQDYRQLERWQKELHNVRQ